MSRANTRTNTGLTGTSSAVHSSSVIFNGSPTQKIVSSQNDDLNSIIGSIDNFLYDITETQLKSISSRDISTYIGTSTFSTFSIPVGSSLEDAIKVIGDQLAVEGNRIIAIAPSSINEPRTPVNYTASGSDLTKLDAHITGIDNELGTLTTNVASNSANKLTNIDDSKKVEEHTEADTTYGTGWVSSTSSLVYSGVSLDVTVPITLAYILGYRIDKTSTDTVSLTATKDCYIYLDKDGNWGHVAVAPEASVQTS